MEDYVINAAVGRAFYFNAAATAEHWNVNFNKSLKVSIAGDGTNGVFFIYSRYLT